MITAAFCSYSELQREKTETIRKCISECNENTSECLDARFEANEVDLDVKRAEAGKQCSSVVILSMSELSSHLGTRLSGCLRWFLTAPLHHQFVERFSSTPFWDGVALLWLVSLYFYS